MSESNTVSLRAGDQVKLVSHPGQKGTAAALALAAGVAPAALEVATLRAALLRAGAILSLPG